MGDRWGMANTLHNLGFQAKTLGEYEVVGAFYERSLALSRGLEDAWGTAYSLEALALIKLEEGITRRLIRPWRKAWFWEEDWEISRGSRVRWSALRGQLAGKGSLSGLLGSSGQPRRC